MRNPMRVRDGETLHVVDASRIEAVQVTLVATEDYRAAVLVVSFAGGFHTRSAYDKGAELWAIALFEAGVLEQADVDELLEHLQPMGR